ncbi:hypothetical protein CEV34_1647 [Brucella pseudogrignonensis]|uniref:Uncharacterized protein n=1 Tax=Brucella pseudogrignonensis TaxID=419475 RepID=A0A256GJI7_9HYPH|nr:hypothetical protein CEV34_1647 [Brucella pseudogrignonensis]
MSSNAIRPSWLERSVLRPGSDNILSIDDSHVPRKIRKAEAQNVKGASK